VSCGWIQGWKFSRGSFVWRFNVVYPNFFCASRMGQPARQDEIDVCIIVVQRWNVNVQISRCLGKCSIRRFSRVAAEGKAAAVDPLPALVFQLPCLCRSAASAPSWKQSSLNCLVILSSNQFLKTNSASYLPASSTSLSSSSLSKSLILRRSR
jgi:hypothetical protein